VGRKREFFFHFRKQQEETVCSLACISYTPTYPNSPLRDSTMASCTSQQLSWACSGFSALEGDEVLIPSKAEQLRSIEKEATFKDQHILFERSRSSTVGPRFFSYFSQLLQDLGMSSHIHKSNLVSDFLEPYGAEDYYGVLKAIATRRRRHRQKEKLMHSNGFRVGQQSKNKSKE